MKYTNNLVKPINEMKLKSTGKEYNLFVDILEEEAVNQFAECLSSPYVVKGALMPDAHTGYTLCIGGVIAAKEHIFPAYVGMDIGCGMAALKTEFKKQEVESKRIEIFKELENNLPVGRAKNKKPKEFIHNHNITKVAREIFEKRGGDQLGTLGGGNHFCEIGYDENENVWIVIHSGSRGTGGGIAEHYIKLAYTQTINEEKQKKELIEKYTNKFINNNKNENIKKYNLKAYEEKLETFVKTNVNKELEKLKNIIPDNIKGNYSFNVNSQNGKDYIRDLNFALDYALENRKEMIRIVHDILNKELNKKYSIDFSVDGEFINRNHNHAEKNKDELWIHRKGATHAEKGMYGVIPGNMRDGSFIVRGKGNKKSLCSSSHGTGRIYSRQQAKKTIDIKDFKETMNGITAKVREETLDESPFAYKDIFKVMEDQKDLVEVINHVKPLINIKG